MHTTTATAVRSWVPTASSTTAEAAPVRKGAASEANATRGRGARSRPLVVSSSRLPGRPDRTSQPVAVADMAAAPEPLQQSPICPTNATQPAGPGADRSPDGPVQRSAIPKTPRRGHGGGRCRCLAGELQRARHGHWDRARISAMSIPSRATFCRSATAWTPICRAVAAMLPPCSSRWRVMKAISKAFFAVL